MSECSLLLVDDEDLVKADIPTADGEMVRACQAGDREGQRKIYESHSSRIYRLMHRMVGPTDANDLTQQVFLRVFKTIGQYAARSAFSTWLYRLAVNEALQFIRRNQRLTVTVDALNASEPNSAQTRFDERDTLEFALSRLEPSLRSIFVLREVEKLSYSDLALSLNIPEGTVGSRLNRARSQLRDMLRETL